MAKFDWVPFADLRLRSLLHSPTVPPPVTAKTKQYNVVPAKGGDLFGWESNRGPGGK